jgi:ABC-type antimicrobial peptide transport system permease subunit
MMLNTSLRIAYKALRQNKLRTGLAVLGMTIGVAAVLTMFALGTGAQESVSSDVKSAGTTLIFVRSGNFTRGGEESKIPTGLGNANTLMPGDADSLRQIPGIQYAAGWVMDRGWVETTDQRFFTQVIGADTAFPDMYGWTFEKGKFYKHSDVDSAANVAAIGTTLRDKLFGDENPVGKTIRIRNQPYRIVGVFNAKDGDQSEMALVPYTSLQKQLGRPSLQGITVAAEQAGEASRISADIKTTLRKRHHIGEAPSGMPAAGSALGGNQAPSADAGIPDDFTVKTQAAEALTKGLYTSVAAFVLANMPQVDQVNMQEMSGTLNRAGKTMTALLAAIATISLIVGGVGIMNIMLVSVTERTREIGIRRAVGARSSDVRQQFLVEAVSLSLIGGAFGIVAGFLAALIVTYVLQWPAAISFTAVLLGFGIAAAVGVGFGFYPAQRASRLNPIDALRYE